MKLFISWSGPAAEMIAKSLKEFCCNILDLKDADIFFSTEIMKGARWREEVFKQLLECNHGVVCITPESKESRWLLFESGALATKEQNCPLFTFLRRVRPSDVSEPLSTFQHASADHNGTLDLMRSIYAVIPKQRRPELRTFESRFEKLWPDFEKALEKSDSLPSSTSSPRRSNEDLLAEILMAVRDLNSNPLQSLSRIRPDHLRLLTAYIGEFPAVFGDVRKCVAQAESRIRIICDFLAYGTFSDPAGAREYRGILQTKAQEFARLGKESGVEIIVPNSRHQRHLQELQFSNGAEAWKKVTSDPTFMERLAVVNEYQRADQAVNSMERFHEFLQIREQTVRKELEENGVIVTEVEEIPTTFCWLVDDREAIFTMPIFGRDAHEQGFHTSDSRLLRMFTAMCDYFKNHNYRLSSASE